jgi:hypothetical protein
MSTLGEILEQMRDPAVVRRLMAEAGDKVMAARIDELARNRDGGVGKFALDAVDAFTRRAGNDDWVKLMGRIQGAESPAAACLIEMMQWTIAR